MKKISFILGGVVAAIVYYLLDIYWAYSGNSLVKAVIFGCVMALVFFLIQKISSKAK